MVEFDGDLDKFKHLGHDGIFKMGWVLDKEGVMDLDEDLTYVRSPQVKHSSVEYVCDGALGIIGYGLANSSIIVTAAKKPTTTPCKRSEVAVSKEP